MLRVYVREYTSSIILWTLWPQMPYLIALCNFSLLTVSGLARSQAMSAREINEWQVTTVWCNLKKYWESSTPCLPAYFSQWTLWEATADVQMSSVTPNLFLENEQGLINPSKSNQDSLLRTFPSKAEHERKTRRQKEVTQNKEKEVSLHAGRCLQPPPSLN